MAYDNELEFVYRNPTAVVYRENAVTEAGIYVDDLGCSRAFVITDPGVIGAGLTERLEKALGNKLVGTFADCCQDSGHHIVNQAAEMAREKGADCVVTIGGGSVIDTGKGVSILLASGGELHDYQGFQMLSGPQTPHIAIPTTAGTGAEVTNVAVIKDWDRDQKQLLGDNNIFPNVAILDPTLTVGLPPMLTATTGMDALCHAIEGIVDIPREPMADAMGMQCIRLIMKNLPVCVENGKDLVARGMQLVAATMGGLTFCNSQAGLVHAISHTLGGLYKVPHGLGNSLMLPYVMQYNLEDEETADVYASVAEAMGLDTAGMSDREAGEAAANAIWDFTKKMGVPQKLSEVGVPEDGLEKVADMAMSDGAIVYNARMVLDASEIVDILKKAY